MTRQQESLTITVSGPPDQLSAFAALCATVEYLCTAGSSRTVTVDVDGDGAADLRFDYGDTDVSAIEPAEVTGDDVVRVAGIGT